MTFKVEWRQRREIKVQMWKEQNFGHIDSCKAQHERVLDDQLGTMVH